MTRLYFIIIIILTSSFATSQEIISSEVELIKVVMSLDNGTKIKGYIIDIDEESIYTINKKEFITNKMSSNCLKCERTAIDQISKLVIKRNRRYIGKVIGSIALGVPAGYFGANSTVENGNVTSRTISQSLFYGSIGTCIGAGADIIHNHNKDKRGLLVKRQVLKSSKEVKERIKQLYRYSTQSQIKMLNREGFINFYSLESDQLD